MSIGSFAGNAFAVYDIERVLFGTSLGINPDHALAAGCPRESHARD